MTDEQVVYVRQRDADDLTHHRPQYVYEGRCPVHTFEPDQVVICQLTSNVNESIIWCDDDCREMQEWTQLRKSFASMGTRFATVWQDQGIPNLATGQIESDPKKFREHLHVASREMEERIGMPVDYQPTDPSDTFHSDEGLDATHDQQVRDGVKDSRGRFVWQV